jgi:hypothetical protein
MAAWSDDGELYAPFNDSDLVVIEEGQPRLLPGIPGSDTRFLATPLDDGALLVADHRGDATVVDIETGQVINGPWPAGGTETFVHGVELAGHDVLALVRSDDTIHLWSRVGGNALSETLPPIRTSSPAAYYLPGADVVRGSTDTTVWAISEGTAVAVDFGIEDVSDVALSPTTEGDVAVVVDGNGRATVHELPSGRQVGQPIDLGTPEASGRLTEDRRVLVVQVPEGLRVLHFGTGQDLGRFGHNLTASSYTRVQHGLAAVVVANTTGSSAINTTMVVDLETLEQLYRGPGLTSVLLPDRRGFASDAGPAVAPDTGFSLVDFESGEALWSIPGTGFMGGFDPSGRFVVTIQDEIQYLDFDSRQPVGPSVAGAATMAWAGAPITQVRDGRIHVWKSDPTVWPEIACQLAGRNLTRAEWETWLPSGLPYDPSCEQWPVDS